MGKFRRKIVDPPESGVSPEPVDAPPDRSGIMYAEGVESLSSTLQHALSAAIPGNLIVLAWAPTESGASVVYDAGAGPRKVALS